MVGKSSVLFRCAGASLLAATLTLPALAQESDSASGQDSLETVVVTGSLIPQTSNTPAATPVISITSDDMKARGYSSVADALQQGSFATGSSQGSQYTLGFTPGAQTLSMFGLSENYTKYMIDGRPMVDYPALYNGTDNFVSIAGIPSELVDRIDVLPGAESSIYGSDAIAGVVNIIMKKKLDAPFINARYGFTQDGGGVDKRLAAGTSFSAGSLNILVGGQYEKTNPIWGYQRNYTSHFFTGGTTPSTAERDFLVYGLFGQPNGDYYYFEDPASCANVSHLFGGTVAERTRQYAGNYCGTTSAGQYTLANGDEATQGYLSLNDDLGEHARLYANVMINHDLQKQLAGSPFYSTTGDPTSPYYYYEDPNLGYDLINLQRVFAPEEVGGYQNVMNKFTTNTWRGVVGSSGTLASPDWTYDVSFLYTQQKLTETDYVLFSDAMTNFLTPMFGPQLGYDPDEGVNIYAPDYAQFYQPITPAEFAGLGGDINSYSRTEQSMLRGQITAANLFQLPGGNAGLALVAEGGAEGWDYSPAADLLNGNAFGLSATPGSGHRSRYAGTAELRLPVLKSVSATLSGRYDDYRVAGDTVSKTTYNLSVEYRPLRTVLLRGRYGTAFKAPTLADEFQQASGYYATLTDYYACTQGGYSGNTLGNCPQYQQSVRGYTSGNTQLKPVTAKVWDLGTVLTPVSGLSLSMDLIHFDVSNEVNTQDANQLLAVDAQCLEGTLDITSPTCVAATTQVVRDGSGTLLSVATPKVNVSNEIANVFIANFNYAVRAGGLGNFEFALSWSDMLKHEYQDYPGDAFDDLLSDAILSTEFKTKANGAVTWTRNQWSATLAGDWYGHSPNYLATVDGYGTPGAGTLGVWMTGNASVRYQATPSLQLSANINNLFNTMPPIDHSYTGIETQPYNTLNYNVYGRTYYLEATYKFSR